jgi:hypothetical protein
MHCVMSAKDEGGKETEAAKRDAGGYTTVAIRRGICDGRKTPPYVLRSGLFSLAYTSFSKGGHLTMSTQGTFDDMQRQYGTRSLTQA